MYHRVKTISMAVIASVATLYGVAVLFAQSPAITGSPVGLPAGAPRVMSKSPAIPGLASDPRAGEYQKIEIRIHELTREYHQQDSDQRREGIRVELEKLTEKQFELKMDTRKQELDRLRKQMEAVAEKVKRREELKHQIIDRRVAELTKEDAELRWDSLFPAPVTAPSGTAADIRRRGAFIDKLKGGFGGRPAPRAQTNPAERSPARSFGIAPGGSIPDLGPDSMSVAEARTRMEIAQRNYQLARAQHEQGLANGEKLAQAEGAIALAQFAYQQAQQALETRRRLLKIEIDRAKLELEAANAKLADLERLGATGAISESELRDARLARARAELNLQSIETYTQALDAGDEVKSAPGKKTAR